ncbi:hypothetical protein [Agrococcus sediminis]|uniref:hypothetical protein n=1 Tax=Agrococcus sediminis TaxID=2599924 RepID=UPI00342C164D
MEWAPVGIVVGVLALVAGLVYFLLNRDPQPWRVEHLEGSNFRITRLGFRAAEIHHVELPHDGLAFWTGPSGEPMGALRRGESHGFHFGDLEFSVRGREAFVVYTVGRSRREREWRVIL